MKVTDIRPADELARFLEYEQSAKPDTLREVGVWRHQKKNGTIIDVEIKAHDIIYEGKKARLILITDVTEKLRAEEKLKKSHEELKLLATHLQEIRDDERRQIAREIHDELGQKLTAVKLDLAWLGKRLQADGSPLFNKVVQTTLLLNESNLAVRRILNELRTDFITRFGLEDGLRLLVNEFTRHSGIPVEFNMNQATDVYPEPVVTSLYRVIQEALTNITKHAQARQVWVNINFKSDVITARITDDGKGFELDKIKAASLFGILGMRERMEQINGTFHISSSPGSGTAVSVTIPILNNKKDTV